MQIGTQEHYDMIEMFDREYKHYRLDKETYDQWSKGRIYQHGEVNELFKAYCRGYSLARCVYQMNGDGAQ